ncbi:HlyD family secretion protein [Pedobacter terrae]|uniref:HlyD family secretion protein n=1 Tax=Pedobacter terrae TaxID=405671 RepID=UPI002FFC8843
MENTKLDIALQSERSEEVQHIIERMPHRFGIWVTLIVLFLFMLMAIFGWIVRYPDVVQGQITINTNSAPLKLVSNTYGKLKILNVRSMDNVKAEQIIAYIENATQPKNVDYISKLLKDYNPNGGNVMELFSHLPKNFSLGDLNVKYYAFTSALQLYINYQKDDLYDKKDASLKEILNEQEKAIKVAKQRITMSENNLNFTHKFFRRDSILFTKKVISEAELDKTQINYISAKDAYQSALSNLAGLRQNLQQTTNQLDELYITKPEKEKELKIALISSYNDLLDNIKVWEQKYLFKAPFDGKIQFLKFYTENQFIQSGEQVFTVIPKQDQLIGQLTIASQGAGKVKEGQEVIVKLDNFPYNEYGSVTGNVKSVSLTSNLTKMEKGDLESYQVLVDFPNELKTNYGTALKAKPETKGTAEIITSDRKLIERLFDNLKYAISK